MITPIPYGEHYRRRLSDLFGYIVAYKRRHDGLSPTLREMQDALGYSSASVVRTDVESLIMEGRLRTLGRSRSRGIMVVGGHWEMAQEAQEMPKGNATTQCYRMWLEEGRLRNEYVGLRPGKDVVTVDQAVREVAKGGEAYVKVNDARYVIERWKEATRDG